MKILIMLQALSSVQAHTNDLKDYAEDMVVERGKPWIWRVCKLSEIVYRKSKKNIYIAITIFYQGESGGTVPMKP